MVALSEFVMSAFAEEFQPAGLQDSMHSIGPPPGLGLIRTPSECNSWMDNSKKLSFPPGLGPESELADAFNAPPGLPCPPGLEAVVHITDDATNNAEVPEEAQCLTEERLRLSNQLLEMESAHLAQQNEFLRTELQSKGQGPPGVWGMQHPNAWEPWCAWTQRSNMWAGCEYPSMLGEWGLARAKDEDQCSEVSDQSTVDLSDGSEDTEDSADSPTGITESDALDASSDDGTTTSSTPSPRSKTHEPS